MKWNLSQRVSKFVAFRNISTSLLFLILSRCRSTTPVFTPCKAPGSPKRVLGFSFLYKSLLKRCKKRNFCFKSLELCKIRLLYTTNILHLFQTIWVLWINLSFTIKYLIFLQDVNNCNFTTCIDIEVFYTRETCLYQMHRVAFGWSC